MVKSLGCILDIVLRVPTKPPPHKANSDKRNDKTYERKKKHNSDQLFIKTILKQCTAVLG